MSKHFILNNIISLLILIFIQTDISRAGLADDLQYSRQTAITRAIEKVSSSVVGINVTQLKQQKVNPFFDPFWGSFLPYTRTFKVKNMTKYSLYFTNKVITVFGDFLKLMTS